MIGHDALFQATHRPDNALLYRRRDPNDRRLGEVVQSHPNAYAEADLVLLGFPQDEGVRRNSGRPGAAHAPDAIRRCLYKFTVLGLEGVRLFDLGNTGIQPLLEAAHDTHRQVVQRVIADGKTLIVIGGGNDISYPDCAGLAEAIPNPLAFNVDAHYDVRADTPRNSGTPYRQLIEEGIVNPAQFYEMGSQPFFNSPVYTRYLREKGTHVVPLVELRAGGIPGLFERIMRESSAESIFWGLDMDVVRASDAPGVSAPNPTGLFGDELCAVAAAAGHDPRSRLLELSEVNPDFDVDQRTCRLAAAVIWSFIAARLGA
ncbi:MAG: formimidoylglutamase [Anaerolineae bacterium]